jgi:hypothetical protein
MKKLKLSFLGTVALGLILKFSNLKGGQKGRYIDNSFVSLQKSFCCDLHFALSLIFVLALIIHFVLNWKTIICYFKTINRKSASN